MLHVGQGTTIGALTVFPVWNGRAGVRRYVTDAAALEVAEVEGGAVPQLGAVNRGGKDVLVLDGQLFEGGWQHRMAARSTVVGAGERATVDVVCVEQGRWGGAREQATRGRRASTHVRAGLVAHGAQGGQAEVWRRVGRDTGGTSTGSTAWLQRRVARLRPMPGQTGVLIGVGGHPLLLEDFDHPRTLAEQYDALLRAAACSALAPTGSTSRCSSATDAACTCAPSRRATRWLSVPDAIIEIARWTGQGE